MIKNKSAIYFENLDSLRAIAAFAVILYHITLWLHFPANQFYNAFKILISVNGQGGALGVNFFFVLSGFLITYLMFAEEKRNGIFNVKLFYLRRFLRIWPLYFLTLIIGFIIYPLLLKLADINYHENASGLLYSLFLTNFDHIYNETSANGILGVQWSVAIEEQFYLVWPLLFFLFHKKNFPLVLICVIMVSELFYIFNAGWQIRYFHTLCNMMFLASGALLAWIAFNKTVWIKKFFSQLSQTMILICYIVVLIFIFFTKHISTQFHLVSYTSNLVQILFFCFVIAEQCYAENSFIKLGRFNLLTGLGKISYGLYLTHMIAIYIVISINEQLNINCWVQMVAVFLITLLISRVSYKYFESYFLKLKNKYAY